MKTRHKLYNKSLTKKITFLSKNILNKKSPVTIEYSHILKNS